MLFDFVDEWISVWTSGFEKSLVHLTSGSESLAKPLNKSTRSTLDFESYVHSQYKRTWTKYFNYTSVVLS